MKIHEYQAKEILEDFGVPVPAGIVVGDPAAIDDSIAQVQREFDSEAVMIKAQIHAGGRGKGGGVKYCPDTATAAAEARLPPNREHLVLVKKLCAVKPSFPLGSNSSKQDTANSAPRVRWYSASVVAPIHRSSPLNARTSTYACPSKTSSAFSPKRR